MSQFWNQWITWIVIANIAGVLWLLVWTRKQSPKDVAEHETCGHNFDGIEEFNRPLPKWWLNLFYLTILFAVLYLAAYPGLGNFKGFLNWSSAYQWEKEAHLAKNLYDPVFADYARKPIETLIEDEQALQVGQRLFLNNCALCHGSDARGARGFPNLTDKDWLYGDTPDAIKTSILNGRTGVMPAFENKFSTQEMDALIAYVVALSGRSSNKQLALEGKSLFQAHCAACHGMDGQGNTALGSANLTDSTWLYGGSPRIIQETITQGRQGSMPAHRDLLGEDKVHVVAAYVYSLSHKPVETHESVEHSH